MPDLFLFPPELLWTLVRQCLCGVWYEQIAATVCKRRAMCARQSARQYKWQRRWWIAVEYNYLLNASIKLTCQESDCYLRCACECIFYTTMNMVAWFVFKFFTPDEVSQLVVCSLLVSISFAANLFHEFSFHHYYSHLYLYLIISSFTCVNTSSNKWQQKY